MEELNTRIQKLSTSDRGEYKGYGGGETDISFLNTLDNTRDNFFKQLIIFNNQYYELYSRRYNNIESSKGKIEAAQDKVSTSKIYYGV